VVVCLILSEMFGVLSEIIWQTRGDVGRVCVTIFIDKDLFRWIEVPAISAQMSPAFMIAKNAKGKKDLAP
jgi:hypothetical protein